MDLTVIPSPLITATAGLVGVLVGSGITAWTTRRTHKERLATDHVLAEWKITADINLAQKRFDFDKEFAATKRLVELVEPTLADFYSAYDAIQYARFFGAIGSEGSTRPRSEDETDGQARYLNTLYVPIERMQKSSDLFSRIFANRYRFHANFGQTAVTPFVKLKEIQSDIYRATFGLSNEALRGRPGKLHEEWEAIIWDGFQDEDPVKPKLNAMIEEIEAICRPILERARGCL